MDLCFHIEEEFRTTAAVPNCQSCNLRSKMHAAASFSLPIVVPSWRLTKAAALAWFSIGMRNLGADVSFLDFIERRRVHRLMKDQLRDAAASPMAIMPIPSRPRGSARRPGYTVAAAILVSGALIAAAVLFVGRWEVIASGPRMYRLDRWTGAVAACNASNQQQSAGYMLGVGVAYRCETPPPPGSQDTIESLLGPRPTDDKPTSSQ
jgi:hypothetical protein